jgi:uncharacterized protein (UPF0276 family)
MNDPIHEPVREHALGAVAGIGLRAPHYRALLEDWPLVGFLEVHSENYLGRGGAHWHYLMEARELYPVSLHGIGASLGSADALSCAHVQKLRELVRAVEPCLVSEHLSWSSIDGRYFHDLLPLPQTRAVIDHVARRIEQVQDFLGRELLVENLSSYLRFADGEMPEWDFVVAIARRAGCALLLDINNIFVSARNHGFDPRAYIDAIPRQLVREIHLAGHAERDGLLIDTHGAPVADEVWALYRHAIERFGGVPTLIEWDADLPALATLVAQAERAQSILGGVDELAA